MSVEEIWVESCARDPAPPSERLWQRFRELGVGWIGDAEAMTDDELVEAAATLRNREHKYLVGGTLQLPASVCAKCFWPHPEGEEECVP